MISGIIRLNILRFRLEIAAYWLVSVANSLVLAKDDDHGWLSTLSALEVTTLVWITIRLILAEDAFGITAGWKARPHPPGLSHVVPLILAVFVVFAPLVVRVFVVLNMFSGASGVSPGAFIESWQPQWTAWFALAFAIKLYGLMVLRGINGRARIAAWAVLTVMLFPLTVMVCGKFRNERNFFGSGGSGEDPGVLSEGIRKLLPDGADFIGDWNDESRTLPLELPSARMILRVVPDSRRADPSVSFRSARAAIIGVRVRFQVRLLVADSRMVARLDNAVPVLRFADGTYATCAHHRRANNPVKVPLLSAHEWIFSGDFISPLSLPEFEGGPEDLTRGLELLFFEPDWNQPRIKSGAGSRESLDGNPEVVIFQPATMDELFTQFPWPDDVWEKTARPFLLARATEKDVPILLDKLEMDNRLMSVFIGKGWRDEAMPALRKLLKERIPMGIECIEELAREQDPSLAEDLKAVALHHTRGLERLEKALRSQPGFDWRGYVLEAWKRQKYSNNWLEPWGEFWIFALWAAREGDFTAFRLTAERAALGKTWEQQQLAGLVAGEPPDMLEFLRRNIDAMKFDAESRRWFVPAG